jgi:hypothetical protein
MAEKWAEMDKNGVETVKMGKIGIFFWKKLRKKKEKKKASSVKRVEMGRLEPFFEG